MVGVHIGELAVDEQDDLVLAALLPLADVRGDDPLGLLAQARVAVHLRKEKTVMDLVEWLPSPLLHTGFTICPTGGSNRKRQASLSEQKKLSARKDEHKKESSKKYVMQRSKQYGHKTLVSPSPLWDGPRTKKMPFLPLSLGFLGISVPLTLSSPSLTVFCSSSVTIPTTFVAGSLSALICFLATTSKACPGVNSPMRTPGLSRKWKRRRKMKGKIENRRRGGTESG